MFVVSYFNQKLHQLFDFSIRASQSKYALLALVVVSFTESSFFLVPPDVLLIAMAVAKPNKAFYYAFVCTLFSVLGGIFGYFIGQYGFELVGQKLIEYYNYQDKFSYVQSLFTNYGSIAIFVAGFSPIPYKIFTITSGFVKLNLVLFIAVSFIARGLRFCLIAFLINRYGENAKTFTENHLGKLTIAFSLLLIVGFALLYI